MTNLRKSWLPIYLFAAAAILTNEHSARAFTLIETSWLPAVQLIAGQSAEIKVTNTSANTITVVITTYRDSGTIITQQTQSIATGTTFTIGLKAPVNGPLSFHASLASDTAQAAIADVMTFDIDNSEVVAILPFVKFDTQ